MLTGASGSIAITGPFNAHHARTAPGCHRKPIGAAQCRLPLPKTAVK
jgi:hypothetical protein